MEKIYSIEVGHIYQDMELNQKYANLIKKSIQKIESLNIKNYQTKILIDELNIKDKKWEIEDLINFISKHNLSIDKIAYESRFALIAKEILNSLSKKKLIWTKENGIENLFIKDGRKKVKLLTKKDDDIKYSCPLLSACWQICRLGKMKYPEGSFLKINNKEIIPNTVINVIEKKYLKVEENVEIILKDLKLNKNVLNYVI